MDLGSLLFSVCVTVVCVPGPARCSMDGAGDKCPCSEIPTMSRTKPVSRDCFFNTYRYSCVDGYVRQAGTSNLIRCKKENGALQWTRSSLICIPDPLRDITQPPVTPSSTTKDHTDVLQSFTVPAATTATSTGFLKTPNRSVSAAETSSAEPASAEGDLTKVETDATEWTTSTTSTEPLSDRTVSSHVSGRNEQRLYKTETGVGVCISLVIVCAFFGVGYFCYRRRSTKRSWATEEETTAMNSLPSGAAPLSL